MLGCWCVFERRGMCAACGRPAGKAETTQIDQPNIPHLAQDRVDILGVVERAALQSLLNLRVRVVCAARANALLC